MMTLRFVSSLFLMRASCNALRLNSLTPRIRNEPVGEYGEKFNHPMSVLEEMEEIGMEGIALLDNNGATKTANATEKPLLFIHVHKAAGNTMCHLGQMFENLAQAGQHADSCCNIYDVEARIDDRMNQIGTRSSEGFASCGERANYMKRNIYSYSQIERGLREDDVRRECFDRFRFATLLRDPVDLAISASNWDKFNLTRVVQEHLERIGQPSPHDGFAHLFVDNYIIRTLLGKLGREIPIGGVTEEHAHLLISILKDFVYVGIVEDLSTHKVEADLEKVLGWSGIHMVHANTGAHDVTLADGLDLELARTLKEAVKYDYKVYNFFKKQGRAFHA